MITAAQVDDAAAELDRVAGFLERAAPRFGAMHGAVAGEVAGLRSCWTGPVA